MALKNQPKVKHVIVTGAVRELNFYVSDALRANPGFVITKVVLLNGPKDAAYSETSVLSLLYVLVNDGNTLAEVLDETEKPVSKNGEKAAKVNA